MSDKICPHCEKETIGAYCHHCGQKQDVHRLEWRNLADDLQKRVFGFDNNYMRTVKDLTLRPGKVIEAIIEGVRVKYIGPVGYYFLMLTLFVLLVSILDIDMAEFSRTFVPENQDEFQKNFQQKWSESIFSNFRVFSFLLAPFFIMGVWLIFRNKKFNFLETAVVYFYGQGHTFILSIIALFIYYFAEDNNMMAYVLPLSVAYFGYSCASFYQGNKIWNFFKGILGLALGYIFFMLIFLIGMIVYLILNPELIEQMKQ